MDFFKPGSTLKREDPKAHSYEHTRARDGYKKQLQIFKIRFEHELAKHPKLDFDAKQEVRIRAKRLREMCLSNYRESLQGLATTNHRRNYKDLFLGTRDISYEMHDTNILDYELRLASEIDTIISNLKLMKADKSNRETLDWMASLAKQRFSYEQFEEEAHPHEVEIDLELETAQEEEHPYNYEEDLAGPIYLSRRHKSPVHANGHSSPRYGSREGSILNGDDCPTFNREFNYAKSSKVLDECDEPDEEEFEKRPTLPSKRREITLSPVRDSLLDVAYCDFIHKDDRPRHDREENPFRMDERSYRRSRAPKPPVDVDNEEDVEEFLARSRALLRKSARPTNLSFLEDDEEED